MFLSDRAISLLTFFIIITVITGNLISRQLGIHNRYFCISCFYASFCINERAVTGNSLTESM
nr:MAG TPA: hypothetical protein [Caudoviricetes sp.]